MISKFSIIKGKNYNVTIRPVTSNTLRDAKNAKRCDSALKIRYIRSSALTLKKIFTKKPPILWENAR